MSDATTSPRRAGRPRGASLTEAQIAGAALDIIDTSGWQSCTMHALATRLGVRAPSLYHHVDGQLGIIDLVRGVLVPQIHDPVIVEQPWEEAVFEFGLRYYRVFAKHPNTVQTLSTASVRDPVTLQMYEAFVTAAIRGGWNGSVAFEALVAIEHLALGFALEQNAEDWLLSVSDVAELGAPQLAEIISARTLSHSPHVEHSFRTVLTHLIHAFHTHAEKH